MGVTGRAELMPLEEEMRSVVVVGIRSGQAVLEDDYVFLSGSVFFASVGVVGVGTLGRVRYRNGD
jgi:hypothetical protein